MSDRAVEPPGLASQLATTVRTLADLRRQLDLITTPGRQPGLASAFHSAYVDFSLGRASAFRNAVFRPFAPNATWVDMPTLRSQRIAAAQQLLTEAQWKRAFPDYREQILNVIANEEYVITERRATATHRGPLRVAARTIAPTGRRFVIESAEVIRLRGGRIATIEHYYDMASVLRRLGFIPDTPLGHDEREATLPIVLHASGFAPREGVRPRRAGTWPVAVGESRSVGSSDTAEAKRNVENCLAIHEAFVEHAPERFSELIAADAVWIDVPTGEVLNGAAAAAHHDHGNWMTAFPDSSAEVTSLIGNEGWVGVQHRGFGTHLGPLQLGGRTYEPTGRKVDIRVLDLVQYRDGQAVLIRNYYDMAVMLVQLGIVPGQPIGR